LYNVVQIFDPNIALRYSFGEGKERFAFLWNSVEDGASGY